MEVMQLKGRIERVNFYKPDSGFFLARIKVAGQRNVIVVGVVAQPLSVGLTIDFQGEYKDSEKYGHQFNFTSYTIIQDDPTMGIRSYLSSRRFKGIGEKLANRIVDAYGQTTIEKLTNGTGLHASIPGLTSTKVRNLIKIMRKYKDEHIIYVTLMQQGLTYNQVEKIIKAHGATTLSAIHTNPYILMQLDGFGFFMCDAMAQKTGVGLDSPFRLAAGLIQTIKDKGNREGHTWMSECDLCNDASKLLGVDASLLVQPLHTLVETKELIDYQKAEIPGVMLPTDHRNETRIATDLKRMKRSKHRPLKNPDEALNHYLKSLSYTLDPSQLECIQSALVEPLMILTGGPGTGKTTIVKGIVSIFSSLGLTIELAAPTGKAAKRLSESCDKEAKTIHRLLECYFDKKTGAPRFKRNKKHPLLIQALIVDECSMMDCAIFARLLDALPSNCRLILVGDEDQLPSVGAGNVFADLIHSAFVPLHRLTIIHRQKSTSYIPLNAANIIQGKLPIILNDRKQTDFWFIQVDDGKTIAQTTVDVVRSLLKTDRCTPEMIQVLTPMKKGDEGTGALNQKLKDLFNPDPKGIAVHGLNQNDRVIQTSNNYSMTCVDETGNAMEEGVFNGDMGMVETIESDGSAMTIRFNDRRKAAYQYEEINQLEMAYALTVHKSQGSEFDVVVMPLPNGYPMIINRRLLYTALTRAKKLMILVSTIENLRVTIANNQISKRMTILSDLLQ